MILGRVLHPAGGAGLMVLRVVVGLVFLYHGSQKVGIIGEEGFTEALQGAVKAAEMVGMPPFMGYVLAFTELIGGLCLIAGFATRYFALGLAFAMVMAAWKVHGPNGIDIRNGGMEYTAVLAAACVCLVFAGAGLLSLDGLWDRNPKT
jgi:putative oxidoreductase